MLFFLTIYHYVFKSKKKKRLNKNYFKETKEMKQSKLCSQLCKDNFWYILDAQ